MRAVNLIPAGQRSGSAVGAGRSEGGAYVVVATATTQAASAQAAAGALAPYTNFVTLREQRTQAVAALVASRFDWAHAIHELGRVLTPKTSIGSLTGTIAATATAAGAAAPSSAGSSAATNTSTSAPPTGPATGPAASSAVASATPPGSVPTFTLAGCATTQPAVAQMLGRLRLIDGVSEVVLQSSTKSTSGAGSGASGSCPSGDPAFTVLVSFDPLPVAPAATAGTSTVSNLAGGSTATAPTTAPGVSK
jgi:hypothetical protein